MKMLFSTKLRLVVVTASIFLLPVQQLLAANPHLAAGAGQSPAIRDVALQTGGVMHGQVVDAQGNPCDQVAVRVVRTSDPTPLAVVQTDSQGRFAVSGLSGGVYRVETPAGAAMYRLWAPNTAPPSATDVRVGHARRSDDARQLGRSWLVRMDADRIGCRRGDRDPVGPG